MSESPFKSPKKLLRKAIITSPGRPPLDVALEALKPHLEGVDYNFVGLIMFIFFINKTRGICPRPPLRSKKHDINNRRPGHFNL